MVEHNSNPEHNKHTQSSDKVVNQEISIMQRSLSLCFFVSVHHTLLKWTFMDLNNRENNETRQKSYGTSKD